jgi:hypothetical protein
MDFPDRVLSPRAMEYAMSRSGDCGGRIRPAWAAAALALLAVLSSVARAADVETRDYSVVVGSKPAGDVHLTIHRHDNGSTYVRCDTDIKVKVGLTEYKFIYRGFEEWKAQRLVKFESNTDDNGKRFYVSAAAEKDSVRVKVNNAEKLVPAHVWLTSYWSLPDEKLRGQELPLLEADNGQATSGKLKFVATEKMKVGGQMIPLNHYKLSGKLNVDLWYDGSDRLVRQEWLESGHKTVMELVKVRR